jgi:cell division protein FtsZ
MADDVLRQGIQGISELITQPGLINVDFSHVRNMMLNGGGSLLAIGTGEGENKAMQALENALRHPMLETIGLENATGIIANFTGGSNLSFVEVASALNQLQERTGNHAEIIPGVITDDRMEDRVQVILVITGIRATGVETAHRQTQTPIQKVREEEEVAPISLENTDQDPSQSQYEMAGSFVDLDIPAFLRRRVH